MAKKPQTELLVYDLKICKRNETILLINNQTKPHELTRFGLFYNLNDFSAHPSFLMALI